ncbi:aminotransferase class V-fold PLP-dependent enzyme [bacterium]|nr:aminotransferase class V-fold PLP-dependent enzyme [bacterium]
MGIYEELGIKRIVNGNATLTRLGGSIMPRQVIEAMIEASEAFVDIVELQGRVGREIARLTRNEAAYVSSGCAAALVLSTAACITGLDPEKRERLPHLEGLQDEVIVHRMGRVGYDFAVRQTGVRLVEIGTERGTTEEDLRRAMSERTAAVLCFLRPDWTERGLIPLDRLIAVAHERGVPVIVDAAAQVPPVSNLWSITGMGADLALFSGGKGLRGPQSAGLILGRKDLIDACAFNGPPHPFIGRPMKVGKEEMVGMLVALRLYLARNERDLLDRYERQVKYLVDTFNGLPGLTVRRAFPSEAGQPMPRAEVVLDERRLEITRDEVLRRLMDGDPAVSLAAAGKGGLYVNPQTLEEGEEKVVAQRLKEILRLEA